MHVRPADGKRAGGADRGAGTAVETFFFVSLDVLGKAFHPDPKSLQVPDTSLEIFPVPTQFQDHQPLFSWIDGRLQDIEGQIELPHKINRNGLVGNLLWKPQGKYF